MKPQNRETLDAYYAEAASWNRDRVQAIQTSQRVAWWIAAVAALIALFEAVALVLLTPLKTVVPYTLLVDRTTGYVQALKPLDQTTVSPDSALTQSFLVQYVIAREGYDQATLNTSYRKVALFSADQARSTYLHDISVSNPKSPLVVYPRTTIVDVKVKSVSPLGANAALVRFDTIRSDARAQSQPAASWVAVVRYRYSTAPMSVDDRFTNPLGFQVAGYRKDPEAVTQAPSDLVATPTNTAVDATSNPTKTGPYRGEATRGARATESAAQ